MNQDRTGDVRTEGYITDGFWSRYIELVRDVVVPYQWEVLNDRVPDAAPSHAIDNFRIAAGEKQGDYYGMVFQDSDVAKWLEAVAYLLRRQPDATLERQADDTIELIARAQQPDGYLNTYYICNTAEPRWSNLCECHELYCAGHMIEAAVAYFEATGKRRLLEVMCRFVEHIDAVFGHEAGQIAGYDGHPEIELALMRLYEVTGNERHLALCRFFVDERGRQPHFYDREWEKRGGTHHDFGAGGDGVQPFMLHDKGYSQAHLPVYEQDRAVGHAVRFVYLCTGMAQLAQHSGDERLMAACRRLWDNMATRQLYVTGGIGAQAPRESFTCDFDLPNDAIYGETCAAIGLMFLARQMLMVETDRRYADVMERSLYNNVLAGMALDGQHFFYVNPLEVDPKVLGDNLVLQHVKPVRQRWFTCACCPPNLARLIASLDRYVVGCADNTAFVHLYIGGDYALPLADGTLRLHQQSELPWGSNVSMTVQADNAVNATLALRIPAWAAGFSLDINGEASDISPGDNGYLSIERQWVDGDRISLSFEMPIRRVYPHRAVRHDAGRVALQRGPLVYCMEQADNGEQLHNMALYQGGTLETAEGSDELEGMTLIRAAAVRDAEADSDSLYRFDSAPMKSECTATFIPYFAWANRGEGEMRVWVREVR
ncbi:glycoside hydrolase family 127 protein [Kushneria aurantia]|uniref:Glycoside hydrolase family 127 protein n=1 Tax=Kushneria aurantia TaxID=504092 RepID=A0ABV6G3S2_9GAMM|nr:beta-L-arabinofuranosidase domain-containing protein [Kushneria aurantia]